MLLLLLLLLLLSSWPNESCETAGRREGLAFLHASFSQFLILIFPTSTFRRCHSSVCCRNTHKHVQTLPQQIHTQAHIDVATADTHTSTYRRCHSSVYCRYTHKHVQTLPQHSVVSKTCMRTHAHTSTYKQAHDIYFFLKKG